LRILTTRSLNAVLRIAQAGQDVAGQGGDQQRPMAVEELQFDEGVDAEFSNFLGDLDRMAKASKSKSKKASTKGGGGDCGGDGGGAVDETCGPERLEHEDGILWGRLSFLNEAVLRNMHLTVALEHDDDDDDDGIDRESRWPPRASDRLSPAAFKDQYVASFTAAFSKELEDLQQDKVLQQQGAVGLELLALALETGVSTYDDEERRILLLQSLKDVGCLQ
jgi:hypothetical protein